MIFNSEVLRDNMTEIPVAAYLHSLIFANSVCRQTTEITRTLTCVQKKGMNM